MEKDKCSCSFFNMCPEELTLLATAVSLIIAEGLEGCQQEVIGNFLLSIGQQIVTFSAQSNCLSKS
jgi:hypothetical protein